MTTKAIQGDEEPRQISKSMVMKALDYGYDKAINGLPGMETAEELAQSYINESGTIQKRAASLVNWQVAKAGTSGFITGLGGIITLPVALPANIVSVLYVQIRMVAAIAVMGGHDIRKDQVKTFIYMCLCGSAATDLVKDLGIKVGTKLTQTSIRRISGAVLTKINQAVGGRLLTKFGQKGIINLGKGIPLIGGVIGGTVDAVATKTVGYFAIKKFIHSTPKSPNKKKK